MAVGVHGQHMISMRIVHTDTTDEFASSDCICMMCDGHASCIACGNAMLALRSVSIQ